MKLSRTVVYAIQATLQLAQMGSDEPVPCSQLAAEGHMPERFLLQILRHLVTHKILHSTRGVEGGYVLNRKAEEVSLLDVIEAIEGPMASSLPPVDGHAASIHMDRLREALDEITASTRLQLTGIKLADLMATSADLAAEPR
jgi:Rrf2 family transcriptional regulator, cysteine metabolism repressor